MPSNYPDDFRGLPGEAETRERRHQANQDAVRSAGSRAFSSVEDLMLLLDGDASEKTEDLAGMVSLAEAIEGCVATTRALMRRNS